MIRGVVSKVSSNPYNGKQLWSFRLNGDNAYYNTGETPPPVEVGKTYDFEVKISASGKPNVILGTIAEVESGSPVTSAPVAQFKKTYGATGGFKKDPDKDAYWLNKEARDVRNDGLRELGATRNTAIAVVDLLIKTEALKLPAKQSDKEEVVWAAIQTYTDRLMKGQVTTEKQAEREDDHGADEAKWG